jgi:hypothetical protein
MQGQILLFGGDLALFNCAFWRCLSCSRVGQFIAPDLPDEPGDAAPGVQELKRRADLIKERVLQNQKRENYGIRKHRGGKFVVVVEGDYIGHYGSHEEAVRVRDAAISEKQAEKFQYHLNDKNHSENPEQSTQTA